MWIRIGNLAVFSILLLSCFQLSEPLVVPQELPSILSLVYSNIPPIKKGTDSRLGFGFRLGEHADFQVMLELGPQKETRPIGEKAESENSFSKRHVSKMQQMALLRQQQLQQSQELSSTERIASSWLETWSNDMNANKKHSKTKSKQRQPSTAKAQHEKGMPVVPMAAVLPEQSFKQLQLLYKMATTTTTLPADSSESNSITTSTSTSTTVKPFLGGALNLGGLSGFQLPRDPEMPSQLLNVVQPRKTKGEITAELMDVSLEAEE